jgi:hypothetical protein
LHEKTPSTARTGNHSGVQGIARTQRPRERRPWAIGKPHDGTSTSGGPSPSRGVSLSEGQSLSEGATDRTRTLSTGFGDGQHGRQEGTVPARRLGRPPGACRVDGTKAVRTTAGRPRGSCVPRARHDWLPKAPGARACHKRSLGPQEPPRRALACQDREPQAPGAGSCTPFPSLPHTRLQKESAE